jgi:uncharacterized protein
MNGFTNAVEKIIFGNRQVIIAIFALITVVAAYFASQLKVDAGFHKQLPNGHEYVRTFLDHEEQYGGANRILVAVIDDSGNMFNKNFFVTMEGVTEAIKAIKPVNSGTVRSIFTPNTRFVEVVEGGFAGGNVIPATFTPSDPNFTPSDQDFETIRSNIVKANIVGRLVAKDFSGAMVMAELIPDSAAKKLNTPLNYQEIAKELEAVRTKYEKDGVKVHIIGFAKVVGDISDGAKSVVTFFAVALVLTTVLLIWFTGSVKLSIWTLTVAILSVVWMMGGLRLLGFGIDPMNILTPFLVFAVGVSHAVQMTSSWLNQYLYGGEEDAAQLAQSQGVDALEAAKRSFRVLLIPGTIALLSDLIGFATIYFIDIQIIRELAITACVGVAAIILLNLIFHPVVLSMTSFKDYDRVRAKGIAAAQKDGFWRALAVFARPKMAWVVAGVVAVLFVVAWEGAKGLKIGDSEAGVPELRPEARFNQDAARISSKFALGIDVINVIVETDKQACTDSPAALKTMDRLAWHMQNVEGVQQVITLSQYAKVINAGYNEGNIRWRAVPRNKYIMRQNLQSIETDTGLLNSDCSAFPVQIFLADHKSETITRVINEVKKFRDDPANKAKFANFRVESDKIFADAAAKGEEAAPRDVVNARLATGSAGVMAATNETVAAEEKKILIWVYIAVLVLCLVTYRSLRATLCIVIPLALVSLLANALMAKLNIGLKVNTLAVAALGVGIGVDYAIYIYSRMEEFLKRGDSIYSAYLKALKLTGKAVIFTAATLGVGVATWIFSALKFQADMGVLLAFMFIMNGLGAIIVLPALLTLMLGRKYPGKAPAA